MWRLAPLFGVSPATVCRVIQRLRPLPVIEPASRPADAVDRLWIVDGTLIRSATGRSTLPGATTGSRQTCRSSSTPTRGSWSPATRSAPGNTADAQVWRNFGLPAQCQGVTVLSDGAYINTGLVVRTANAPAGTYWSARNKIKQLTDGVPYASSLPSPRSRAPRRSPQGCSPPGCDGLDRVVQTVAALPAVTVLRFLADRHRPPRAPSLIHRPTREAGQFVGPQMISELRSLAHRAAGHRSRDTDHVRPSVRTPLSDGAGETVATGFVVNS